MMMTTAAANSRKPMVSESVGSGMASGGPEHRRGRCSGRVRVRLPGEGDDVRQIDAFLGAGPEADHLTARAQGRTAPQPVAVFVERSGPGAQQLVVQGNFGVGHNMAGQRAVKGLRRRVVLAGDHGRSPS